MSFNPVPVQPWRRFLQTVALFVVGGLAAAVLFDRPDAGNGRPATVEVPKTAEVRTAQAPTAKSRFERQVAELHRLYQAAPTLSVEELVVREESELENDSTMAIAALQTPAQFRIPAHPSNFGDRLSRDTRGKLLDNPLLVVLHETTSAASGAVNTVLTPHPHDDDQISYHAIICQDGTILYLVDPLKRAYGAGNSAFKGKNGLETVQTNKNLKPSVNNFAYHISLETPSGGYNSNSEHVGYSGEQYTSLAWLTAHSGVEDSRITTHLAVDRSGERQDPRSFEMDWLKQDLALQRTDFVSLGATP
ncbi:peptidoglycan recognition family protein [Altericista sp. CCNU0014]|uniref:peptidoglycan recognition protein family protein n=1 Tax=Altericista sp. CCNU0014 TaxID=3082949 RepID=UPI00384F6004